MDLVILERRVDPPMQLDDVHAMEQRAAWCMEQHRVRHVTTLLSLDGGTLTCALFAPDAEAVRSVLRQLGAPYERVWPARVHAPDDFAGDAPLDALDAGLVVVERRFAAPVELASLQAAEDRGAWCLAAHRVRFVRSYFACDRRQMICVYAAPDAESVRSAQRQAGLPFETAWAARPYDTRA